MGCRCYPAGGRIGKTYNRRDKNVSNAASSDEHGEGIVDALRLDVYLASAAALFGSALIGPRL
jgi:hypothetical protein